MEDILGDDSEFVGMDLLMDPDGEDAGELDAISLQSACANSAVTTQLTRDRLKAKEKEIKEMEANMSAKEQELQEQRFELQQKLQRISDLEKLKDAIAAVKDAEIAELMHRLEATTTGAHRTLPNQSNETVNARDPPMQALISPPCLPNKFQLMDTLLCEEDAASHASPPKVGVVED